MNPMTLNRTELIHELRGHTTKHELDKLVKLPTAEIRAALAYSLSSEQDQNDRAIPEKHTSFGEHLVRFIDTAKLRGDSIELTVTHKCKIP